MERSFDITARDALDDAARDVLSLLRSRSRTGAAVLACSGDLGAGKTTFLQMLARELGVAEPVTSPTFVIMKHYDTTDAQFPRFVHVDAYRIETVDELEVLRFDEVLQDSGTIIGIEWAERVTPIVPSDALQLTFALDDDGTRTLTVAQ